MDAKLIDEIEVLQIRFAEAQKIGGGLALQLSALERDDREINARLENAFRNRKDVRPILAEVKDNLLNRAQTCHDYAANLTTVEALCRQSAAAIQKMIS